MKKDYGDELYYYYCKWLKDRNHYYIPEFIEKLIKTNLVKQKFKRFTNFDSEEFKEQIHNLRIKCYEKLNNLEEPTSKRIYNYLDCTVRYGLLHCRKDLAKYIDQKPFIVDAESLEVKNITSSDDDSLTYLKEDQKSLADLILAGYTNQEIIDKLDITKNELIKRKSKLKELLKPNGY